MIRASFHNLKPNCSFVVVLPDLKCLLMPRKRKKVLRCPGPSWTQSDNPTGFCWRTIRPEQIVVLSSAVTLSPSNELHRQQLSRLKIPQKVTCELFNWVPLGHYGWLLELMPRVSRLFSRSGPCGLLKHCFPFSIWAASLLKGRKCKGGLSLSL